MNISKLGQQIQALVSEQASQAKTAKDASTDTGVQSTTAGQSADIRLSPLSEKLKALSTEFSANASFDSEKVEALKAAIANGTFKVNADTVADKMIAEAREMTGKKI